MDSFLLPYPPLQMRSITSTASGERLITSVTGFYWAVTQRSSFALVSKREIRARSRYFNLVLTPYPNGIL